MTNTATLEYLANPVNIDSRYVVEETLGRGGMGIVYRVFDTKTQKTLALKQLLSKRQEKDQEQAARLFEFEYYVLSQLAHPRIVEVIDFSRVDSGAYYTMELLDGGDLSGVAPLPWRKVCGLLCDVCSALSLLHSRRLVHRDLSTRNIHCTQDKKAKLIDFGAMIPFGVSKQVVGTPPFVAPETLFRQTVDARTDLYALGANAYFLLTNHHAYPARNFASLHDLWRSPPPPPSRYVSDIPTELDQLIMSLLQLDIIARPERAADVMTRLSAIADLEIDERLVVQKSYLSTPTLVGRDDSLVTVRKQLVHAKRGRGGTLFVSGCAGVGRSRFLDACLLEGKLIGATVLRADATDASKGNWGVVRVLSSQLIESMPAIALQAAEPFVAVLGHILPELLTATSSQVDQNVEEVVPTESKSTVSHTETRKSGWRSTSHSTSETSQPITLKFFASPEEQRGELQEALYKWMFKTSTHRCLVLVVDDLHQIDESSAAFLALLSRKAPKGHILIVFSAEIHAHAVAKKALSMLSQQATPVELLDLDLEDTRKLLGSIFGDVPYLLRIADKFFSISKGNPRTIIQLAQHLVDKGLVRYQSGCWTLADSIDLSELPDTLSEALSLRVNELSKDALELVQIIALCSKQNFSFDKLRTFNSSRDTADLVRVLEELVKLEILTTNGEVFSLSHQGWRAVLTKELDIERMRSLYLRIAQGLKVGVDEQLRTAHYFLLADEPERALNALVAHASWFEKKSVAERLQYIADNLLADKYWIDTYQSLIQVCKQLKRPRKQWYLLQSQLVRIDSATTQLPLLYFRQVVEQLYRDSGLDLYEEQDPSQEPSVRLTRALDLAQKRFDATPEAERVLPPAEAIPALARTIYLGLLRASFELNMEFYESLPSLSPFAILSPAFEIIQKTVMTAMHIQAGRTLECRRIALDIVNRLRQKDRAGLQESVYTQMYLATIYLLGAVEVGLGIASAKQWIEEIEKIPYFSVYAWRLRIIDALRQGDLAKAEIAKKQLELLQIQSQPVQSIEKATLWLELQAYCAFDDLVRLEQIIPKLKKYAEKMEVWVPFLHFAGGQLQRMRGNHQAALGELESALQLARPGRHQAWSHIAGAYLATLVDFGEVERARNLGRAFLETCEHEKLDVKMVHIAQPLALAEVVLGEFERAVEHAQAAVDMLEKIGSTGFLRGSVHETRARVAIMMNDLENFTIHAQKCAEQYRSGRNFALTAKYQNLIRQARTADFYISMELADAADLETRLEEVAPSKLFSTCHGAQERIEYVLSLITKRCNCSAGFLYTLQENGPILSAQQGSQNPPPELDVLVADYLSNELDDTHMVTATAINMSEHAAIDTTWQNSEGERFVPMKLSHQSDGGHLITGVAVLRIESIDRFDFPIRLLSILSKSLIDSGDITNAIPIDQSESG